MDKRVAILGAGQLAKYLAFAAKKLKISVTVIATSELEPACLDGNRRMVFPWTPELFLKVFQEHDLVTFENEWISDRLLQRVREKGLLEKMFPHYECMNEVRTKWDQKKFFSKQKYPTTKAVLGSSVDFLKIESFKNINDQFSNGVVLKESELAYDGKGVFVFKAQEQSLIFEKAQELIQKGKTWYLEERVDFQKEMALVFSRNTRGEFAHYPLVEFQSENGICSSVYVEKKDTLEAHKLEQQAVEIARDLSQKIKWVGTAAIEFFVGPKQELLINEFAPRVHNSGHFSLSASSTSQFENHMRAITGLTLGDCKTAPFAMMKNLIGTKDSKFSHPPEKREEIELFWYGKHEIRPGRKMGHVNAFGSLDQKSQIISKVDETVEKWKLATILGA